MNHLVESRVTLVELAGSVKKRLRDMRLRVASRHIGIVLEIGAEIFGCCKARGEVGLLRLSEDFFGESVRLQALDCGADWGIYNCF